MAALDRAKEKLGYFKLWQGIIVVTHISLIGWLVSAKEPGTLLAALAICALAVMTAGIWRLHRHIELLIDQTGTL
jgi:hypothetical protein